jgi:uncharacterized protein (TIGR02453 family)
MAGVTSQLFPDEAFDFYEGLVADNSKTYWLAQKEVYERSVRRPMQELLEKLAPKFDTDRVSMFRPYRDVRFSKDKSPYKTHQGGLLEVDPSCGYYLQVDAEGVRVAAGFWARERAQTARFRAAVDSDLTGPELVRIVTRLEKAGFEIGGEQVRTHPRGVSPDHPRLQLMRREFVTAGRNYAPDEVSAATVEKAWRTMSPLVDWVRHNCPPELDARLRGSEA